MSIRPEFYLFHHSAPDKPNNSPNNSDSFKKTNFISGEIVSIIIIQTKDHPNFSGGDSAENDLSHVSIIFIRQSPRSVVLAFFRITYHMQRLLMTDISLKFIISVLSPCNSFQEPGDLISNECYFRNKERNNKTNNKKNRHW